VDSDRKRAAGARASRRVVLPSPLPPVMAMSPGGAVVRSRVRGALKRVRPWRERRRGRIYTPPSLGEGFTVDSVGVVRWSIR
jgi:hypothetical protein